MTQGRKPLWTIMAAGFGLAVSVGFYLWTVESTKAGMHFWGQKQDYYNLLTRGFLKGHLYLDAAPDPALLALPQKERPGNAPFMLDASLYQNHYYLYFGLAPVLLLFLPYALACGQGFPEAGAAFVFASLGSVFAVLWWNEVRRRFFPGMRAWWSGLSVLALSIGSAVLSTLRRPLFYEVAIASGYAFAMLSLWAFLKARYAGGNAGRWLVVGGLAAGLAVGSRANLAPACALLVVFGAIAASVERPKTLARSVALSGVSLGVILAMLAAYNWMRFGNPVEFGHRYQLGVEPTRLFHVDNFLHNAWVYYLSPPALNGYFPFVAPAAEAIKPPDYVGRESAHGEFVWVPLALVAILGLAFSPKLRARRGEWAWVFGYPLIIFSVNFAITASVGVRANRYMLDFHPALVLLVVSALGMWAELRSQAVRACLGVAMLAAVLFNLLGSLQAHGLFLATDPGAYSRFAMISDRLVWPLLRSRPEVGDRLVNLRWPLQPSLGQSEPLCSAGCGGDDDVVWFDYGRENSARIAYQYSDLGRTYGPWFPISPGGASSVRLSGALLLPRVGHPWYGRRPRVEQGILKRSLVVTVDGTVRFDRDVPSHDSSPGLENWGTWRHLDGVVRAFSGPALRTTLVPLDGTRASQAIGASGAIRMRLQLAPDSAGRFEPLVQSGSYRKFDTLVLHLVRPGYIQLVHDQLGSGARWSDEFRVDYGRPQIVEVDLPFADDRVDWRGGEPEFRTVPTDRMRVRWNGRTVFEPEAAVAPSTRPEVSLGVNILRSSVCQAMFDGLIEGEPGDRNLGGVRPGDIHLDGVTSRAFEADCGLLARFSRADSVESALCWAKDGPTGAIRLGWSEGGSTRWSDRLVPARVLDRLVVGISDNGAPVGGVWTGGADQPTGRFVVDAEQTTVLAIRTNYFGNRPVAAAGSPVGEWSGTAFTPSVAKTIAVAPLRAFALPGRIRLAVLIERDRPISSSPLVEAGSRGAADSLYLRALGGQRYVVGLDHWGVGAAESVPFKLAAGQVANFDVEMSSLEAPALRTREGVRVSIDGQTLLDRATTLYPVKVGQIYFGSNPLGMTTSTKVIEGDLVSVRVRREDR